MRWGKQVWFCPNCGARHYNEKACRDTATALAAACSDGCLKEWQMKEARLILGKDQDDPS